MQRMEDYFLSLTSVLDRAIEPGERYTAWFAAEQSDFVRMNRGRVRQPGTVTQRSLRIELIRSARHASHTLSLSTSIATDRQAITRAVAALRTALPELADDPHLLLSERVASSRMVREGGLPPSEAIVDEVLAAASGTDFVGLLAAGPLYRGFANSEGQRNWHAATTFNLQWSLYHRADKAVKSGFAGFAWDGAEFVRKMVDARERLTLISRAPKTLEPGRYRVYLAPRALEEVAALLCWGGFSGRALATKQSSLGRMHAGNASIRACMSSRHRVGCRARVSRRRFHAADRVSLIESGALVGSLVSPRTAREFGLATNGANGHEAPEALSIAVAIFQCAKHSTHSARASRSAISGTSIIRIDQPVE
jgi:predicted Zn-dependent protease